jgi:Ca2+-binding EF-hand superfamily protein
LFLAFRYAFQTFDANHDGAIDFEEFLLTIAASSQGSLDERLAVAFDLYTSNTSLVYSDIYSFAHSDMITAMMDKSIRRNWLHLS